MDDLISRQAAVEALEAKKDKSAKGDMGCFYNTIIQNDIDALKGLPSAQPEIVRCRECKYWREHKYARETKRYIPFCGFNAIYTKADDFCSKGTRRTE